MNITCGSKIYFFSILLLALQILPGCTPELSPIEKLAEKLRLKTYNSKVLNENKIKISVKDGEILLGPIKEKSQLKLSMQLLEMKNASLYKPGSAPYPGAITNTVSCDKDELLKELKVERPQGHFLGYRAFANNRKVIGACSKDEIYYEAIQGFLVPVKGEYFYEITYFFKQDSLKKMSESLNDFLESLGG